MRGRVDDRVQPVPVRLVAVQAVVLDRRDHLLRLDPVDRRGDDFRAEQRVLGDVLEIAAVAWVAYEVDATGQLHVEAAASRFASDQRPGGPRQLPVEAGSQGQPRRQCRRGIPRPIPGIRHPKAGVAHLQRGNAQPRHAANVAGAHHSIRGNARVAHR